MIMLSSRARLAVSQCLISPRISRKSAYLCVMATTTHEYWVDMTCGGCSKAVNTVVSKVPGVTNIDIDLPSKKVAVTGTASDESISEAIKKTGKKSSKWSDKPSS